MFLGMGARSRLKYSGSDRFFHFFSISFAGALLFFSSLPVFAESNSGSIATELQQRTFSAAAVDNPSLIGLAGVSEVAVLADLDGQFLRGIISNPLFVGDAARQQADLTLRDSVSSGRSFSRDSKSAQARIDQAAAQSEQAFAMLLPNVAIRGSYGIEISDPSVAVDSNGKPLENDSHSRTDLSLTVRQPLFDLPSYLDWQRRKVIEKSRGESYRISDGDAYLASVNAYLALVSSRLQINLTRDFETRLADLLQYVEKRASAGAASVSDMARVKARSQATLSSRLEQEAAHSAAGIDFIRLTNLVPQKLKLPQLSDIGLESLPNSFSDAVSVSLKSNPEISSLMSELQAAEMDCSSAKSRYLPRLDAEYTDTYSQHAGGDTRAAGQRDKRMMLVLNWNLFSGGSDYQAHTERTGRVRELRFKLDDQMRRVIQALSANYAILSTTRERISSGYQEYKAISTAAEAMSKRMLSGNQSLLDLLDVYDRYYQSQSRLVSLHILEMTTIAQLIRLTSGTPGGERISSSKLDAGEAVAVKQN